MKTLTFAVLLSISYPQSDSVLVAPKPMTVSVDTAKTANDSTQTKKSGLPAITAIGSIVALLILYLIVGPKK